jgi:hypothetical protein
VLGEQISVSSDPDPPELAVVGGFFIRHMLAVVCAGFAVLFVVIGLSCTARSCASGGSCWRWRRGGDPEAADMVAFNVIGI